MRTYIIVYALLLVIFDKTYVLFLFKIARTNFSKTIDKREPMFYNINQNKRAEHLCKLKREVHRKERYI